jgi:hypothetical protein
MRLMNKYILGFLFIAVSFFNETKAQIYPVAVNPMQLGPMSIYFDDFYSVIQPKIKVLVTLNDLSVGQHDVYLKVKLTGPDLTIQTIPGQKPNQPTTLFSGIPLDLSGVDLEQFFDFNKLSFSGITRSQLEINSRLQEGAYSLCFTVMDYESNTPLSSETCLPLQLALSDPPQIINPSFGGVVTDINPSNFMINWMLTNSNSLIDIGNVNYQINLYEVTSNTTMPQNAIINNQALLVWQSPLLNQYVYNYGITDPPLEVGKRYVFNVQAIENYPRSQIKNNGFSTPSWFYFGYPEGGTIDIVLPDDNYQFKLTDPGLFRWKKPNNAISNQLLSYDIKIVEVDSNQTKEDAISQNTPFDAYTTEPTINNTVSYVMTNEKLNSMDRMQKYAWQVTGKTGNQTTAQSPIYAYTGPPYLDGFYAANFYVEIVNLVAFDTITGEISGRGRVKINSGPTDFTEFNFSNIFLAQAGNNLWILNTGEIKDEIIFNSYIVPPSTVSTNGPITFQPDSIYLTTNFLKLGGKLFWQLPLITQNSTPSVFESEYTFIDLSSGSYLLATENPVPMGENENVLLLEPYGFELKLEYTSELFIYQSKYGAILDGFIQLPSKVKDVDGSTLLMPFTDQTKLHYMIENGQSPAPERIDFLTDSDFGFRGKNYVIDLFELESPGDFAQDSTWKGVYFNEVNLMIPENGEESGQLSANDELAVLLPNLVGDSITFFVDNTGLNALAKIPFQSSEQLFFNTFPSTNTTLNIEIVENEFQSGELLGGIYIPFVDTDRVFTYTVPLTNFGFQIGNIDESLVGLDFIHNAGGSDEEKVNMHVTRAVFKNKERIEFDLDAQWPKFNVALSNLQNLTVWGNGNIGFTIPNGAASLNNQAVAKSGDYDMIIDYVGCGRDQNAYAFGVSAKMNMAENISGVGGAPVVNAYSMYINPRLTGQFLGSGSSNSILPGFNQGGQAGDSSVSAITNAHLNNLNNSIGDFADSLGVDLSDTTNTDDDLIGEDNFIKMGEILDLVEIFIPFIDSAKQYKAKDYVTVGREIIEGDAYKALTSKNPKEYIQDVLLEAVDGIIVKVNQPIVNATNKVNEKIEGVMTQYVKNPIQGTIDTILTKVFDEIETSTTSSIEDTLVKNTIKSIINNVKVQVRNEIVLNINGSIDTNITLPITGFIRGALSNQITNFIRDQITYVAEEFIREGVNADINLSNIVDNADTLFNSLKDTLIDAFKRGGSIQNIVATGKSLVTDAFDNMDWSKVKDSILKFAAQEGVSALLLAGLNQVFDNFDSGILDGLMNNVSFDFTNLGEKIQDGDLTGIVKFDPTNIKIETSACNIQGQLKHTKDDPQYGDHWRASVSVQFKKPEKLKGIGLEALFITGKTSFSAPAITSIPDTTGTTVVDTSKYSYWFASLAITGLQIPLSPIPLEMSGIDGFAYHHMQRANPQAFPLPCRDNKLGLGIGFIFNDLATHGKLLKLDLQLEVIINTGDWAMELSTIADVAHRSGSQGSYSNPLATATGIMGYYSHIKTFKGQIDIVFHTSPLLCAGGTIKFNFDGLNNTWEISAGTQAQPMYAKLLCKDWLAITTFIEAQNEGLKAGMNLNIDIAAKSPWIDFGAVQVRGVAAFYIQLDTYVDLQFQPEFRLLEAYVYLNMGASIGVDYKIGGSDNINNFTIAGIALSGYGHYKAAPEGYLNGGLSGTVTVMGISCGLSINVNYDLGNRSDNS